MIVDKIHNLDLQKRLASISEMKSVFEVLDAMRNLAFELGASQISYHLTPKMHSQIGSSVQLVADGFSEELLTLYQQDDFRECDPIPDTIMRHGEPMLWSDAISSAKLSNEQTKFLLECRKHGLVEGIGLPLFGPKGRNGYSSITFDDETILSDKFMVSTLAALGAAAHSRVCAILEKKEQSNIHLSERENQVVKLIANGRSNKAIASNLDISDSTVDTYVRRVFAKLDVSDRVGASIRALELGVLQF